MDNIWSNFWLNGGLERGIKERKIQEINGDILRNQVNDYTIDSCYTFDEGYETAIWYKNNKIIIVERYKTKEEMKKGHKKWMKFCEKNPKKVYSVQLDRIENFENKRLINNG